MGGKTFCPAVKLEVDASLAWDPPLCMLCPASTIMGVALVGVERDGEPPA